MYQERCPFCGQELLFEFFDDLEAHVMACREALGSLAATPSRLDDLLSLVERL